MTVDLGGCNCLLAVSVGDDGSKMGELFPFNNCTGSNNIFLSISDFVFFVALLMLFGTIVSRSSSVGMSSISGRV